MRALPAYLFNLAGSVIAYALIFFASAAKRYFSRSTRRERAFTVRGILSTLLLLFAAFTMHSIVMGAFRKTLPTNIAWIAMGVFLTPAILLSAVARWDLQRWSAEISAALLAAVVFFAYVLVTSYINVNALAPVAMPYYGWLQSVLLTSVLGLAALAFVAFAARRRPVISV